MYKFTTKILYVMLAMLLFNNVVFGVSAEFKNSLMKVELVKITDNSYNVDLYTKNKFIEPIKVIKKSDLNYYILLPETKNESTRTKTIGTDIRGVATNVYSYPGQDVENGYVKISIDTIKPLEFKINVRSAAAAAQIDEQSAQVVLNEDGVELAEKKSEIQTQKKNSNSSISKTTQKVKEAVTAKFNKKEKQQEKVLTIEEAVREEVERVKKENRLKGKQSKPIDIIEDAINNNESLSRADLENIDEILKREQKKSKKYSPSPDKKNDNNRAKSILFAFFVFVLVLTIPFFVFYYYTKIRASKMGLRAKNRVKQPCYSSSFNQNDDNNGKYFVFDKNIKQTGLYDPATSAIKEPSGHEIKNKYSKNVYDETDIIQKILKEERETKKSSATNETFRQQVDINQLDKNYTAMPLPKENRQVQKNKKNIVEKKEIESNEVSEPKVLSKVEISNGHGFFLVSYNNNINLMGYIYDDVFPLYNFRASSLDSYKIQYRLSDSSDGEDYYIVKVDNIRILVAANKISMTTEVLL